jgi:hypothetical protein
MASWSNYIEPFNKWLKSQIAQNSKNRITGNGGPHMNGNLEPGQVGAALPDLCIHPGNAHQDHDNSLHMLLICHNSSHHVLSLTIILLQVLYQD